MLARVARYVGAAALAALGAACLSPTLPLPPPEQPDNIETDETLSEWTIRGSCLVGAEVVVLDEATGRGAVYEDRSGFGHYTLVIQGSRCDIVTVRQAVGDDTSGETGFVLQETLGGTVTDPSACAP